ncbi:MAG TPA: hypothetical protein VNX68_03770, partial [Nitrosopumilaceae archaeon]|nr:hypothetical protein [Nitrosopumilaceae archaeon]
MKNKIYYFLTSLFLTTMTSFAQDNWTLSDTSGFGNGGYTQTSNLISFNGKLFATSGSFNHLLFSSPNGHPGSWGYVSGPWTSGFDITNVAKTFSGGGYMFVGGYEGVSTDGNVFSSADGTTWNLFMQRFVEHVVDIRTYKSSGINDSIFICYGQVIWKGPINANDPLNTNNSFRVVDSLVKTPGIAANTT